MRFLCLKMLAERELFASQLRGWSLSEQAIETLGFFGIEDVRTLAELPDGMLEKMSKMIRFRQERRL